MSAPNILFEFTEEVFLIDNITAEEITTDKNTTLRFSEIVREVVINNFLKLPKSLPAPIKNIKYELNILKKSIDKDIPKRFHDQFESLVKKFSDIFFPNQNGS